MFSFLIADSGAMWQTLGMKTQVAKSAPAAKKPYDAEEYEKLAARLRSMGIHVPAKKAYMKTFGLAQDDPTFEEAMRLGAEWRTGINQKSISGVKS